MPKAAGAAAERRFAYCKKKRPPDGAFFCGNRLLAPPHPPCIPPSHGKGGLFKNPVPWGNLTLLPCGGNFTTLPRGKGGKTPRTFRKVRGVKQKAVPAKRGFLAPLNTCFKGGAAERRGDGRSDLSAWNKKHNCLRRKVLRGRGLRKSSECVKINEKTGGRKNNEQGRCLFELRA